MYNSQLLEIFRCLDQTDISELNLFLDSKFNNRSNLRKDLIALFHLIVSEFPEFPEDHLKKDNIYSRLFPDQPKVRGKLEKTASELNKLIRDYLLWKSFQDNGSGFLRSSQWLKILRENALDHRYSQYLAKVKKEFLDNFSLSPQLYFQRFLVDYEQHVWMSSVNTAKQDINLSATIDSLSVFFEIYRMELLNRLLTQQKVTQLEILPSVQRNMNACFNLTPIESNVILLISSRINALLLKTSPSLDEFTGLMSLLKTYESKIHPDCLFEYYTYIRNFCTSLIDKNHDHLIPVLHQIHQDDLRRGYLYSEGKILATSYLNITKVALMASNIDWAFDFVESHKDLVLGETESNEFYNINKAQCLFAQRQFQRALDILPSTSENALYYLLARRLELMCYYEQKSPMIINKIEAFKMMIRRASEKFLSPYQKNVNNAFFNLLYQIVVSQPDDEKRGEKIAERIKAKAPVAETRWLLAKARALGETRG